MSTILEHAEDLPAQQGSPDNFTGPVQVRAIAGGQGAPMNVGRVTFGRGARTRWHTHTGEQVLYFLEGQGRVQLRGAEAMDAAPGDVARIPPETEHWHGAHPDEAQAMTHLSITVGAPTWLEPVSDEEYHG